MSLVISGVPVPLHAVLDLSQRYEVIGGRTDLRLANGNALRQTHWQRLRTVIEGGGWMPPGLVAIDYSAPVIIDCLTPRSLVTTALTATLPSARRSDAEHAPRAWAWVANEYQPAQMAIAGDTATLTAVTGAEHYRIDYWPQLVCLADPPQESGEPGAASYRWSLTAEEA